MRLIKVSEMKKYTYVLLNEYSGNTLPAYP